LVCLAVDKILKRSSDVVPTAEKGICCLCKDYGNCDSESCLGTVQLCISMTVDYIEAVHDVMIQHVLNFQMIVWQQTTIYINKIVHAIACDGSARGVFGI